MGTPDPAAPGAASTSVGAGAAILCPGGSNPHPHRGGRDWILGTNHPARLRSLILRSGGVGILAGLAVVTVREFLTWLLP